MSRIARPRASSTLERLIREHFGGATSSSGIAVDSDKAMAFGVVYTCVLILAQSLGQTPLKLHRRAGDKHDVARDHDLHWLVNKDPNEWMTSSEMKTLIMVHLLLKGNSLWLKTGFPGSRKVFELIPIHPDRVDGVQQDERYRISYRIKRPKTGEVDTIPREKILHFKNISICGTVGLSPIEQAREMIGLGMAAEKHGAVMFKNGTRLGGYLKHPQTISQAAHDRLLTSWNNSYSGVENAHKTALLEEGMEFQGVTMTAEDAQFLETRKHQRSEICGLFRIPSHLANDLEKATFSNVEHLDLGFVKHTLNPWFTSIEERFEKDLLTREERKEYFFKFNADGLLRGDIKTRYEAYKTGISWGFLNANEVRKKEDMNPYEGGNQYRVQSNTEPASGKNEP